MGKSIKIDKLIKMISMEHIFYNPINDKIKMKIKKMKKDVLFCQLTCIYENNGCL